ncbi:hypothetical protein ACI5OG_004238 [Salmonella enterica subsp. enterica serovar Derby]|jgi:hypothetical protein|uniref:Uncharacterized protein n=2 Tax=Enterobacteriaceae TaxID=543 RepID=A0A8S7RVK5_ECOLX|nr:MULTISPECIES: hypothetical protein [Enterobacteriaceae]EBO3235206.1 hypothetical protein [Salmonella enterica subsp. enterica serovar Corvallis]ECI1117997.1 hypothetical protein [Salmonella enterica subsp. enterica]ECU6091197.1 hypothetical protein [Salmonella enterica subsp. enterica serovar Derby]EDA3550998.1 hypothetical protein [Salmonella enterica subsp. enterica serovar Virchow]EDX7749324.1 hypothetical protein [Salmonella enterica subsp. enterica serovar Thompson]EHD3418360.1 hypoth
MAKFQRNIIFLAMLSACHLSHASVIAAGAAATAVISASAASEHEQRTAINASANTTTVSVTQEKPNIGFVTCGKRYGEMVGSLGCVMWQDDDRTEIPWNSWPGYILGKKLPTSYEVNAISFDQYNSVATVYFSY